MKYSTISTILASVALAQAAVLPRQAANSQTFTGALGGVAATPVTASGDAKRPFAVKTDTFVNQNAALQRSCDQQTNACMNLVNSGGAAFTGADCQSQKQQCDAAN